MKFPLITLLAALAAGIAHAAPVITDTEGQQVTLEAGHPSLQKWKLPSAAPYPDDNRPTPERVELGKKLFFDPRLSGEGTISCASCHSPMLGWSDGLPTSKGTKNMDRASPTIFNSGFNPLQMWDGRKATLESQAMGPLDSKIVMNMDTKKMFAWLNSNPGYRDLFNEAYPGQAINGETVSKAFANFQRTVISNTSPFDQWVAGKADAMTPDQIKGFALFIDANKANCASCHAGPNFTDNSFHNLGLPSFGKENPDMGRYGQKPIASMKGAFRTPTVREAANTAPYFHDGSVNTLEELVEFYAKGGVVKTNLSKSMKELSLSKTEVGQLVSFIEALSSPPAPYALPVLPR